MRNATLPFLRFYESFIDEYESALKKIKNALNSLEPNHNGYISQDFLEHDLEQGLNAADRTTKHLVSKANASIAKVSHIVDLPDLNDNDFHEQNRKALTDINQTIEKLHTFDREQTNALKIAENDLETMQTYIARLEKMYTGLKIEIASYQKGSILKPDENTTINGPVSGLKGALENAESSSMKMMLEKLGEQKDTNVDTLTAPNRVKKLIEKYKIHNESVYNIEKLKFIKYKIKTPNVQVKRFEMPWGPGKISKFGRASEIRKALTENPLKAGEVSKIEKDARTARDVGIVKKNEIIKDGSHITKSGKLKSNVKYQAGEYNYIYKTDKEARIKEFQADDLKLTKRDKRLPHNPKTPGKQLGDHAGHLAAYRFGGSPELDNLVSQSSNVKSKQIQEARK